MLNVTVHICHGLSPFRILYVHFKVQIIKYWFLLNRDLQKWWNKFNVTNLNYIYELGINKRIRLICERRTLDTYTYGLHKRNVVINFDGAGPYRMAHARRSFLVLRLPLSY